jgi:hypothetical protein
MPIIPDAPPDLNPSDQQIAAFQDQVAATNGLANQLLRKIVYPENLIKANSRYGNQFMALYINVTPGGTTFSGANNPPQVKDVNGSTVSNLTGTLHGGSVINKFTGKGVIDTVTLKTASQGGIIRANGQGSQTAYAIYLPVPLNLSTSFGMSYVDFEPGTDASKLIQSTFSGLVGKAAELLGAAGKTVAGGVTKGISDMLGGDTIKNLAEANTGVTINPHKQMLFKGVGLREFDLKYNLVARNQSEANVLDYIIRLLRYYMHPDLDGAFLYKYPDEFDIEFYTLDANGNGVRNKYLPFFSTCVLKNMTINYGGKEFVTHSDGAPVEYELTLKFGETQILNKSVINAFDVAVNGGVLDLAIQTPPGPVSQAALSVQNGFKTVFGVE